MRSLLKLLLVVFVITGAWNSWKSREYVQPPGVVAPQEPKQTELEGGKQIRKGDYSLTALARYDITARLLRRERYRADAGASLSPLDFALGWGPMSDSSVIGQLDISQGGRFYTYRWSDQPPAPPELIAESSANVHLVPADGEIFAKLDKVRQGQVVRLRGYLIEASGPGGFTWKSSLTRKDTGAGACELFYVESVDVIGG